MTSKPDICVAALNDLPALLPLYREYQAHFGQLTVATEERTRAFWADQLQNPSQGFVLMAWAAGEPIGFAAVYLTASGLIAERLAHLGDLYVAPARRGGGVGTALFDRVCEEARGRGIRLVRWLSLSSNTAANRWYERRTKSLGTFELFLQPAGPT